MDMENILGQMEEVTREVGKMENNMEKLTILMLKDTLKEESGMKEQKKN
eukprot:CAMPEP_0205833290 /NCGR_PEP_ID=MMETSP0206-20130828/49304_1 /ASSEMBLY_ACC=CAM_ASM_000279 /TAXON_ID=36767 /ORGANISM="Euplotes focardii, Strain TN1" /LENGTH=48 /DNA_ID= /DNA_START= /DNA_END= /DNA_ORIENTATION=